MTTSPSPWPGPWHRLTLLLAMYLVRALLGAWAVWPIASADLPPLDVLLEPAGLQLTEALRIGRSAWVEALPRVVLAVLMASFFGLWPMAAWLYALCLRAKPTLSQFLSTTLRLFGSLALLGVMVLALQLAMGLSVVLNLSLLANHLSAQATVLAALVVGAGALLAFVFVGIVHDLARAHLVFHDARAWESLWGGVRAMGKGPLLAWAWLALAALMLIAFTAWLSSSLGHTGKLASVIAILVQNLALFGLVALRASFLAFALQRVSTTSNAKAAPYAPERA